MFSADCFSCSHSLRTSVTVRRPSIARYLLVAFLFALGLMSKPMLVTLPLILLLLDYWPLRRTAASSIPDNLKLRSG